MNSMDILMEKYKPRNAKYIYRDKIFDNKGIDYRNYIPLRFNVINNNLIKEHYTVNGWYIIWYLITRGNKEYAEISINDISEDLNISSKTIEKILKYLNDINEIKILEKRYNKNTILHIVIKYYNNYEKNDNINGYKALPMEYIKTILPSLTANQWSIYSTLVVYYSYFTKSNTKDEFGRIVEYDLKGSLYAYPQMISICNNIGITKATLIKELYGNKKIKDNKFIPLISNKYNLINIEKGIYNIYLDEDTCENRIKRENNRYRINLLERTEYIYHHIYNIKETRNKTKIEYINKNGFEKIAKTEKQNILITKDFINYYFKKEMMEYEKWIKNNDAEKYIKYKNEYKIKNYF
ncbi:TPA: hypothetical protein PTV74_003334 [Clostridium botulinum]|nr:hypothetical protein [Clostridium botulinum]HDK7206489.1 hypothetical protein [Clostridium botulinum]HDK7210224.1 hypothetical protein [Clostridium botulinum]HDK7265674.1 hypothetical protein [Clostridium botulinum]HDK7269521.1 hypothetical protein [Clostridium botulinum]